MANSVSSESTADARNSYCLRGQNHTQNTCARPCDSAQPEAGCYSHRQRESRGYISSYRIVAWRGIWNEGGKRPTCSVRTLRGNSSFQGEASHSIVWTAGRDGEQNTENEEFGSSSSWIICDSQRQK
jgi:hypothetical protein